MKFFSGFSLQNEESLFEEILQKNEYTISGFSYGAIKALNATLKALSDGERVDRLQLLSPAFFQTKDEKFKRLQLRSFKRDSAKYLEQFIASCFYPYKERAIEHCEPTYEALEELLYYEWRDDILEKLQTSGVKIEVYLGGEDRIVDVDAAREFFVARTTVTYIKKANHFLQTN